VYLSLTLTLSINVEIFNHVKVKDKYTVELNLKEAYQPALAELAMPRPYVFVSPKDFKNGTTKDGVKI
jgi:nickel transport system substrate-binding protein